MDTPRILVVEDEVVVAMDLTSKLTELGYIVTDMVVSGEEAIKKAGDTTPDLVFMDIKLAGEIDGIEAAEQIRRLHNIPVVYLTAHTDEKTLQKAKLSRPYSYLVKPFPETDLRPTIEVSLHKAREEKRATKAAEWVTIAEDTLGGGVIVTDENGTIVRINAVAEQLTGWKHQDAEGKQIAVVYLLEKLETEAPSAQSYSFVSEDGFQYYSHDCILISAAGVRIPIEAGVWTIPSRDKVGSFVVHCFQENAPRMEVNQDWFSHSVNLLVAAQSKLSESNYLDAVAFHTRGLRIMEHNLGKNHPRLAVLLEDLAAIYGNLGKCDEATMLELRAAKIRSITSVELVCGPNGEEQRNCIESSEASLCVVE